MEEAHIFMFHGKNSGESTSKLSHQDVTGKHLSPVKHEHRKHSSRSELKVDASEEWHLVGGGGRCAVAEMDHSVPCSTI